MDDIKKNCVYCHTNKINGKKYIGITCVKPEYRWCKGEKYKSNTPFYRAIKKYGWDNFTHEILFDGLTRKEACAKEIELIALYKTTQEEYGYNLGTGGEKGAEGSKRTKEQNAKKSALMREVMIKPEVKEHIRASRKNYIYTDEHKKHLSEAHLGHSPTNKGVPMTEEQKAILKERKRAKMTPVICLDTNEKFESIKEASVKMGLRTGNISSVCKGNRKTVSGYRFAYITKAMEEEISC